jgi:DNA-binding response OmpR family regulator
MTIRILADREPYASYADIHDSGIMKGPSGPFVISVGPLAAEEPPPDLVVMPAQEYLSMPPERRSGSVVIVYGDVSDMEEAFRLGCADYLRAPWSLTELAARAGRLVIPRYSFGRDELSLLGDQLRSQSASVRLTEAERRLARLLMLNSGKAVAREALGYAAKGSMQTDKHSLENHISSLRAKFDLLIPCAGTMIKAVRGLGYRLTY